jgi:AcrR family transcriptional regulator
VSPHGAENTVFAVASVLRNEPVQARSTARLEALLDAAAAIVDETGFERLTTAMVADRAGASIGTVYRYFPDRIALLQALGARNLDRVLDRLSLEVVNAPHDDWLSALSATVNVLVTSFRDEPGFRGLRVGDVIDLRPAPEERTYKSSIADRLLEGLAERFGVEITDELRCASEVAIEVSEALAVRAFARSAEGDEDYLRVGREIVYGILSPFFNHTVSA